MLTSPDRLFLAKHAGFAKDVYIFTKYMCLGQEKPQIICISPKCFVSLHVETIYRLHKREGLKNSNKRDNIITKSNTTMKQTYLKSLFLSLLMIVVGNVSANAEEETIATFTASEYNSGTTGGWTVSNADYATAGGGYYKLITSDASIVTPSINWSNYSDITITISARKFGGPDATQGKISVSQGETELTSYSPSGTSIVASSELEISPADGTITISCPGASSSKGCGVGSIIIKGTPAVSKTLSSISLSGTYPTTFKVGDTFSHEGMIVTANYDDNTSENVTAYATFEGYDMSTAGEQEVTVSYTKGEVTKTATYDITVENVLLTGITLSGDYPTTFTVGDTFSHEGMTVTANYDDETTEDVTSSATFEGYDMSTAGDQEVTVSYTKGGVTKTAAYNITVNALTGDAYTLVTNVDDLADGDNVIIVNKDAGKAISTTQATNNRPATGITFDADGNAIVPSSTDIQVFTLEGNTEGWYFNTGSGYIFAASSSSNHLKTETEADDNAKATIEISDGDTADATITFQGTNTHNILKYNSGNNIFSCYTGGQQPVQIYSKPVNKKLTSIMLSGEYPTTFFVGAEFSFGETGTVTAVYDDNSTKVVTELATFSGYDMNTAGTQTVTVSYTERGVTKTQTYDITVNNRALSSITLSGDYPTTFNVGDTFSHEGMTVTATYDNNTSEDVTADATFEGYDMSTAGTQTVTVSYTKADVTKTATYDITVNAVAVTGITLDKEALQLKVGKTKQLTATVEPDNATDKTVVWNSDDESVATVDGGLVTAVAEGTATITVATPDGAQSATCAVTVVETTAATEYYEKVTSAPEDWSGEYLIVYEDGSNAFDGSLETLDAVSNYIEVEIDDDKIEATEDVVASAVTIAKIEDESTYSIKSASGYYIGLLSEGNGLKSSTTTVYQNSISFNTDGTVNVISQNCYLRFNTAENQTRYRYMKSNSSNNKLPLVCLYKKVEATSVTTYSLVVGEEETPFEGLSLTKALPANTQFYIKDNKGNEYHSADAQSELIIFAENHENLPTSADGKDFYLKKANTWGFTLTELTDAAGITLTVNPETPGETKYMLSETYLTESEDVFDENLKLTKEITSTTEEFYFTRSDDYGLTNLTPANFNAPEDRRYWIFSEDDPTVEFIAGEIRGSYTVGEAGTYTFTIDLTNNTVTAENTVEYVDLTISSAEWATYVTPVAVLFPDDVTAYIITEITGGNAKAEQITEAPAGTPVIVNGTAGVHKLLKVEDAVLDYTNMLQVSDGNVTGDGTIFVLAVEGGQPGFAPLANGKKLSAGKAYLQVDNASGAKINLIFDGESSDIRNIENAVDFSDGDWYNLQGVKVTNPQRGIYIHNGKKVVIK